MSTPKGKLEIHERAKAMREGGTFSSLRVKETERGKVYFATLASNAGEIAFCLLDGNFVSRTPGIFESTSVDAIHTFLDRSVGKIAESRIDKSLRKKYHDVN